MSRENFDIKALREAARRYVNELGFSVIPLIYGEKRPKIQWEEFQRRKPTEAELDKWFSEKANIGIICGAVSGNLVVLDFDSMEAYRRAFSKYEQLEKETIIVKTARGIQVYFRSDKPVPSMRFPDIKLDVKGEGSYVVAPPSLHPSGVQYRFLNPAIDKIALIPNFEESLWNLLELKFGIKKPKEFENKCRPENIWKEIKFRKRPKRTIQKIIKYLAEFWVPGCRNKLEMCFLGWALKNGYVYEQVYHIIDVVTDLTNDEEKAHRLYLVDYHYKTRFHMLPKLKGISGIEDVIRRVLRERIRPRKM
ncbi:bifunctional DNA primase/polymerase [bacterium]|nr:bifunctional DNA primase/polymerase [bacterium]